MTFGLRLRMIGAALGVTSLAAAIAPVKKAPGDLDIGNIGSWDDLVQRNMLPQEAEAILSGSFAGDLCQQQQLFISMMDSWDVLANNVRTMEDAVVAAPWELQPFTDKDGKVSDSAKEKHALIEEAFKGMRADPVKQELGRDGMLKLFARAELTGHGVAEVLWERRPCETGEAILPRAVRRTGPRYFGYAGQSRELRFRPGGVGQWTAFPDYKFLTHVVTAHEGHPSQAARLRTLAKYWGGVTYGWEWLMVYSNKFGMPFRWATYKNDAKQLKSQLLAMMGNLGAAGYGAFPEGTKIEMHEASARGGDLPYALLLKLGNQACDLVVRGETETTGTGESKGFSNGDVQDGVLRSAMQGYCNSICTPMNQLVHHLMMLNYGTCEEAPAWVCEIPEPEDAEKNANTDSTLNDMGLPLPLEELMRRHDKTMPADGETVLYKGKLVKWDSKAILTDAAEAKKDPEPKVIAGPGGKPKVPGKKDNQLALAASKTGQGKTVEELVESWLVQGLIEGAEEAEEELTTP